MLLQHAYFTNTATAQVQSACLQLLRSPACKLGYICRILIIIKNNMHICKSVLTLLSGVQIASWWDYGYQTTAMANRTVIVDNNTWNNTHIATVGRAMASPEHQAWQIYRDLDVKYVLVVFGGFVG